ncbi:sulfatase-like hydrolase/transferase [Klebsiella michiganensis]|uniref:sulfatase-like hydrolase/transferase n=1 Tax=Klebsiella TaxID=570 RepID=UPI000DE79A76|nr:MULTISPECIES: sulfatase-like hydrolase/transferase [Klebsiella]MEB6370937.1 sulfatase-like hydrolase/transferase [Klebsiella michiganensis]UXO79607.1 sulfatase-like hydrolase/transferase [Klebsiella michiganensis]SSG25516.1 arylsulfatase [Klebsiella pneumoniae]HBZ7326262.1 sulfatase-like hydrolase/transferase [Klebsiella pneumoniae]HBZ7351967.1 sulfatase-like hydrolase/transferase [Klebsiella pneumoniae]
MTLSRKIQSNLQHHVWKKTPLVLVTATVFSCQVSMAANAAEPQQVVGRTLSESSGPIWPAREDGPKNAPNVIIIMTDDVGFGAASTFGGPIPTPTADKLAENGAKYTSFNTTSMCSPTRASLLTGRLPNEVGMGVASGFPNGYDGYNSVIPESAATIAEILKQSGYNTAMFGKADITPQWEQSQAGPFTRWPTGLGFQYFYGFHAPNASEFEPNLYENTTPVAPPTDPVNYNLDRDLADKAIKWLVEQQVAAPNKPFLLYYSTAAAHAPNHAPNEWLAKFKGKFDQGWDVMRKKTVERQKDLGIIPKDANDAVRPEGLPLWDDLSNDEKKVFARHMEAYAAQLANADYQAGRIIDQVEKQGELENTVIFYIQGDNGAPEEGGPKGQLYDQSSISGVAEPFEERVKRIDDIGTINSYPLIPSAWGWAMNAPFPWAKRYASHFGGTRNGLVVSWPKHIKSASENRNQFHHVSDIAPTILEVANVDVPLEVNGVAQQPMTGISMAYTFAGPKAEPHRKQQIFALGEELAYYEDGWMASTTPFSTFWDKKRKPPVKIDDREWELYNLNEDFTQSKNIASQHPEKLEQMKNLFWLNAGKHNIYPLQGLNFFGQDDRPEYRRGRDVFEYTAPVENLHASAAPTPIGRSFSIDADIVVTETNQSGVLVAQGSRYSGYSLFLDDGYVYFTYKLSPLSVVQLKSRQRLNAGEHTIELTFNSDEEKRHSGGNFILAVDGKDNDKQRTDSSFWIVVDITEGFDIGMDSVSPVDDLYTYESSKFTGQIENIVFKLK